jgi:hypothetical protein
MNSSKCTTIVAVLAWIILLVPVTGSRVYAHNWVDGTPYFREEARLLAQVLGHDDGVMRAPALVDMPAACKVGDEREFYATDMRNGFQYSLTASCRAVSDRAYIFVENGRPAASDKIKSLLAAFDGIYDAITEQFGPPPDTVDGDPRIYILLLDIIDAARADGAQTIGYFDSINQYRNDQLSRWIRQRSNEVEILYIDYATLDFVPDGAEGIVAHEFTHLVQWARDPGESIWIDEGIAVYVEAMLGYEVESLISAFQDEPDTPLLNWFDSLADYGAAYLFFAYVSERFGGTPAVAAIVKSEDRGTESIEQALATLEKPISFPDLFSDWVIANYLDNPDLNDGIYGYSTLDIHLKPSVVESQYPIDHKTSTVEPWAAQYIEFSKGQDDVLDLTVDDNNRWRADIVAHIIEYGGEIRVSSFKSGEAASGGAIISQKSQKAVLVITSQPDPPEWGMRFSSYAYSAETRQVVLSVAPTSGMKITAYSKLATTWGKTKCNGGN